MNLTLTFYHTQHIPFGVIMQNLLRVAWSADGGHVSAGSGDRFVYIWDTTSRRILYKLPGHAGSVNEVDFHPFEPISKWLLTNSCREKIKRPNWWV